MASGSCSATVSGAGCYSSKPNQGCNCATNTVTSTRRQLLALPPTAPTALQGILDEVGCNSTTPAHMPGALAELVPAVLDLRAVLEPFADVLSVPHAKFAGAGGEPLESARAPTSVDEALAMLRLDEPRSVVLLLEELEIVPAPFDAMLSTCLLYTSPSPRDS